MTEPTKYVINTDIRFRPLERVDVSSLVTECKEKWFNQALCQVNDCVVRLGILQGEFHWHHHDEEDEFFYVVEGTLLIDLEDQTIELGPNQGMLVPRKVRHRTRAPKRVVVLMTEGRGVTPTGD